jgi:hypothetical protein
MPVFGSPSTLIPVSDNLFRVEAEPEPTRVFIGGEGSHMVLTGANTYADRLPRWRVESVRWPILISAAIVLTPLVMVVPWTIVGLRRRDTSKRGATWLKVFLLLCASALILPVIGIINVADRDLGVQNLWTAAMFAGTLLLPAAAILAFLFTVDAWRGGASRPLRLYAITVSISALILSGYLSAWGMIGFKPWNF